MKTINRRAALMFVCLGAVCAYQMGCSSGTKKVESAVHAPQLKNPSSHGFVPENVVCPELKYVEGQACTREGDGNRLIIRGDILTPDSVIEGGSVIIEDGLITYVGCSPDLNDSVIVTCPDSVISPGFINGHEHLMYSNNPPADWGNERFDHRNEWRKGKNGHTKVNGPKTKHNETVEIRALMSGTTSIFGSGRIEGLARNIDEEKINGVQSVYQTFPLGDNDGSMRDSDCRYAYHDSVLNSDNGCPFGPHVGEGVGTAAHNELVCLGGEGPHNIFRENLAMIHGVAANAEDIAKMARRDAKLIWSPRTNIALYGDTARVPVFDRLGVTIGLGTDWIYSGSATMLRELQCVDSVNRDYFDHYFSDYQIWLMPTWNNAQAFGLSNVLGAVRQGYIADLVVFRKQQGKNVYRAVIDAENKDVQLVMVDGKLVYGDETLMVSGESIDVCGISKKIDIAASGSSIRFEDALKNANYPMFFCGIPEKEPSCVPQRLRSEDTQKSTAYNGAIEKSVDSDGDGIPDNEDNCPMMFNPIRPQDIDGRQADADGDGIGDICDQWPICAENQTSCPLIVKNDFDSDGIMNDKDNCPYTANFDQADRDGDGKGDVCDDCPDEPNPGEMRCPISVETSIKEANRLVAEVCPDLKTACRSDKEILVKGRVTAVHGHGFFMQMPDENETQHSGIYVASNIPVQVNDDVVVQGYPGRASGMPVLSRSSVKIESSGNEPIKPSVLSAADITTDGPAAADFTGVLVELSPSIVGAHDANAAYGMYLVTDVHGGSIYLDDFIWLISPGLLEGTTLERAVGILVYDFGNYKIAPRGSDDLIIQ